MEISFDVENVGGMDGDEVVQVYVRDLTSRIARPLRELRRFARIHLKKGERRRLSFTLYPDDFAYYDERMRRVVEPGGFEILIGSSSEDIRLKTTVKQEKGFRAEPKVRVAEIAVNEGLLKVEVEAVNAGAIADLLPVNLTLDGAPVEAHRVYLEPGESRRLAFKLKALPGYHRLAVQLGEAREDLEVKILK